MSWMTERLEGSDDYVLQKQNARSEPRLRTGAYAVMITGECKRTYGYARDLSQSGMQIRTFSLCDTWPKSVGEKITIAFALPSQDLRFTCNAKVVWNSLPTEDARGMSLQGVVFEDIDPSVKAKIGEIAGMVN